MNSSCTRYVIAALLVCIGAQALAVPLSGNVAVTVDDAGGRSVDADFSISPNDHLTFSAGAGQSNGTDETAELRGTLLNVGASLHGDRTGMSLSYDRFDDSSNYISATLGARAWLTAGDFEFALLGRQRDMGVELTLALPNRTLRREADFSAVGGGLQVTYARGNFTAYLMALEYEYDDDFNQFLDLVDSPQLEQRPRIEALLGSFLTQAQGAIDRQWGAGVERSFGRHALALDMAWVHDAIIDASSTSLALTYRHAQSAHIDWNVSGGMVDSDRYGNIAFLGVGLGLTN
jgi:hypothetical protein